MGGRGFGVAMDALIKYLGVEHGVTFAMGIALTFCISCLQSSHFIGGFVLVNRTKDILYLLVLFSFSL